MTEKSEKSNDRGIAYRLDRGFRSGKAGIGVGAVVGALIYFLTARWLPENSMWPVVVGSAIVFGVLFGFFFPSELDAYDQAEDTDDIAAADRVESEKLDIETPDGSISATRTTVDPVPQDIQSVSDEVRETFAGYAGLGPGFTERYVPDSSATGLKLYDEAFSAWQVSESRAHSDEQVVQILGAILGNKLAEDFDMEWVVVVDEYGTDYAVRSRKIDAMAFPFSTVLKRITNFEHEFMVGVYYTLKDRLESGEYVERQDAE